MGWLPKMSGNHITHLKMVYLMGKMGERGLFIKERKETIIFFEG